MKILSWLSVLKNLLCGGFQIPVLSVCFEHLWYTLDTYSCVWRSAKWIMSLYHYLRRDLTASQERMMLHDWDAPPLRTMHDKLTGCGILSQNYVLSKWKRKEKLGCENSSRLKKKGFLKKQNFMEGCVPDGWILGPWRREEIFSGSGGRGNGSVGEEREHVRGLNAVRQTTLLMKIQTSSVALFCCLNANQNVCIYDNSK